jgi:hypothetical protein
MNTGEVIGGLRIRNLFLVIAPGVEPLA